VIPLPTAGRTVALVVAVDAFLDWFRDDPATRATYTETLHQLRHSGLTHLAAKGRSAAGLQAKSRHQRLATLGIYVRLGEETAARITAERRAPPAAPAAPALISIPRTGITGNSEVADRQPHQSPEVRAWINCLAWKLRTGQ